MTGLSVVTSAQGPSCRRFPLPRIPTVQALKFLLLLLLAFSTMEKCDPDKKVDWNAVARKAAENPAYQKWAKERAEQRRLGTVKFDTPPVAIPVRARIH